MPNPPPLLRRWLPRILRRIADPGAPTPRARPDPDTDTDTGAPRDPAARFDPALLASLAGLELRARYVMEGFLLGIHPSPRHGANVEFSEYREYQPGDDLRRLDWTLLARSDRLYVKKYEHDTNTRLFLLLDASASMNYRGAGAWASKFEAARVVAAAFAWLALRQNDAVGALALPEHARGPDDAPECLPPAARPGQLGRILALLENLQPRGPDRLPELLEHAARIMPKRSFALLLTDLLEDPQPLQQPLQRLRHEGHDLHVLQILDPDEIDFPFQTDALFQDPETRTITPVNVQTARQTYQQRLQNHLQAHQTQLQNLEIPHTTLRTDQPPWQTLHQAIKHQRRKTR